MNIYVRLERAQFLANNIRHSRGYGEVTVHERSVGFRS
jgi:hypothetical protein